MTPRDRRLRAQAAIEVSIVFTGLLLVVGAIAFFGYAGYQRAWLDHSLSTLASTLPKGWEQMEPKVLAKELILEGSDLDEDDLEVKEASVEIERDVDVDEGGLIPGGLGAGVERTERKRVVIEAVVAYTYEPALSMGKRVTAAGTAHRSYVAYTDYKVS